MSCFKKDSFRMLTASASSSASAMESANGLERLAYLVCLYMGSTQRLGRRVLGDKLVRMMQRHLSMIRTAQLLGRGIDTYAEEIVRARYRGTRCGRIGGTLALR